MGLKVHLLRAFLLSFTGQGRRGRFARRGSESLAIKRDVSLINSVRDICGEHQSKTPTGDRNLSGNWPEKLENCLRRCEK